MANEKFTAVLAIVSLDSIDLQKARSTFFAYKKQRIILDGLFEDDVWPMCDDVARYKLDFSIDKAEFSELQAFLGISLDNFKLYMKFYVIVHLGVLSISTLQKIIYQIKQVVRCPVDDLETLSDNDGLVFAYRVSEFFSMLPQDNHENELNYILDRLDVIEDSVSTNSCSRQRSLAMFESYFKFNDILDRFWAECTDMEEKLFFFPVWMWWHISGVVPMRPREFILTPRNCLSKIDGKPFLSIRKNNIKGSNKTKGYKISADYKLVKYQIPDKLAKEIEWYKNATDDFVGNELNTLFMGDPHYIKWSRSIPSNSRYFTYINLKTCLRYFFEEIIKNRYGYNIIYDREESISVGEKDIDYLHLGDTRHLALINLIAEGATPMVAMMLAGHDNPEMSSHYYSNISTLIECRTYRQYKSLIKGKQHFTLSRSFGSNSLKVGKFVLLEGNNRCYSPKVLAGDYADCSKACGPAGELGFCQNCTYYRPEGKSFKDCKDIYRNRIYSECVNLADIVKKVRHGNGEPEEIAQVLLKLKDVEYSYQQYLLETMEDKNVEK